MTLYNDLMFHYYKVRYELYSSVQFFTAGDTIQYSSIQDNLEIIFYYFDHAI